MAGSVNKVILVGNLGNDPEVRTFGNGGKVANLSIATSEEWRDKQSGEKRSKTEWHKVVITGDGLVGIVERYTKKGSKVYLEGKLQTRKWQNRDGVDQYTTEVAVGFGGKIVLLGDGSGGGRRSSGSSTSRDENSQSNQRSKEDFDLDDEIPFN